MTELSFFEHKIRIDETQAVKRMAAMDICRALGYSDPSTNWSIIKQRNPELAEISVPIKLIATDGKAYSTDTLNLEGIANLCMIARTEKAQDFRRWARRVLAEKIEQKSEIAIPQTYSAALLEAGRLAAENEQLNAQLAIAAPKLESHDRFIDSTGLLLPMHAAKLLGFKPQKLFFEKLSDGGWAYRDSKGKWIASAKAIKQGLLVMKAGTHPQGDREVTHEQMYVTPKGVDYFSQTFKAGE